MATLLPPEDTRSQNHWLRRLWLVFIAILGLAAGLWLAGSGVLRQTVPQPASPTPSSTMPAALNTAADYFALGDYEYDREDYEAAIAAYGRAIELKPDFAQAYNNRAYTYMKIDAYASALPDLDQAIALRPDYVNALINRGDIYNYYYQIDHERAISDYDRVLELDPGNAIACGHRSVAYRSGGDWSHFPGIVGRGSEGGCP